MGRLQLLLQPGVEGVGLVVPIWAEQLTPPRPTHRGLHTQIGPLMDGRGLLTGGEGHYNSASGDLQLLLQLLLLLRRWWCWLAPFALFAPCLAAFAGPIPTARGDAVVAWLDLITRTGPCNTLSSTNRHRSTV